MTNTLRVLISLVLVAIFVGVNFVSNSVQTLLVGQAAVGQFENSDSAHVAAISGMQLGQHFGISILVLLVVLAIIWWKNIKEFLALGAIGLIILGATTPANAYYDKTDWTEAYTILPNESAFYIPDAGANKDSQAKMESEAYYMENKVALKRFVVPHVKLQGSGSFYDFYVPAGRLLIVDRTPYSREWVDAHDRGTSATKQGFPCQSKEGLNITAGVSIGTSVTEAMAAKYLYRFGVLAPQGNRDDAKVIFTSVYYSRKLSDVMDDVGRKKVQTLVCDEIGARTFDEANRDMKVIMETVKKEATDYFISLGISLDFIGWGDTFSFDQVVQESINHRYAATQQALALQSLAPYVSTIQTIASSEALQNFGKKTDGKLPTSMVTVGANPELGAIIGGLFKAPAAAPIPPGAK